MLNFLANRIQKSLNKFKSKHTISEEQIVEVTREIKLALLEADVNLIVVKKFIQNVKQKIIGLNISSSLNPSQQMIKLVKEELVNILTAKSDNLVTLKKDLSTIMMVGLQGSGKTTTTSKLVNFLLRKKIIKKPLIVAADVYRPAAIEQLKKLGEKINVDVYDEGINSKPQDIVKNAIKKANNDKYDFLIIDTAGRLTINEKLMLELKDIKKIANPTDILLVVDALSGQDIVNVAQSFHDKLELTGTIITKLDSDARGGGALSITQMLNIPIKFIGTGEKNDALEQFHPDRMADRILGMGDVLSLIEKAEEVIDEKSAKKITNRMMAGKFDLDDLLEQMKQIKKLGKLSKIMKLLPGMNKIPEEKVKIAEKKYNIFVILMSSMTFKERKNPKLLRQVNRKKRITYGSGRTNQEYNMLISEFEKMKKQMNEIAKSMKNGTFNPSMFGNLSNL